MCIEPTNQPTKLRRSSYLMTQWLCALSNHEPTNQIDWLLKRPIIFIGCRESGENNWGVKDFEGHK